MTNKQTAIAQLELDSSKFFESSRGKRILNQIYDSEDNVYIIDKLCSLKESLVSTIDRLREEIRLEKNLKTYSIRGINGYYYTIFLEVIDANNAQQAYEEIKNRIPNSVTLLEIFCDGMQCPYNSDTEKYMDII